MTDAELTRVLTIADFRAGGFCSRGTKNYAESLNLSFKDLLGGRLTIADLIPHKNDAFVQKILTSILGASHGRW